MTNLYFTIASLPTLTRNIAPVLTTEGFWNYVSHVPEEWKADALSESPQNSTLQAYRNFDRSLRASLARIRQEAQPWKDTDNDFGSEGSEYDAVVVDVLELETPLATEKQLDSIRWDFLDALEEGSEFSLCNFYVYYLKLELLQRAGLMQKHIGQEAFDELHRSILATTDLSTLLGESS